jgi:hypothetical protein
LLAPPSLPAIAAAYEVFRDAFFSAALAASSSALHIVSSAANDPWTLEEGLVIPLYAAAVTPALRALHRFELWLRTRHALGGSTPEWSVSWQCELQRPLKTLAYAFGILWLFDNGLALTAALGISSVSTPSTPLLRGVPTSVYVIWMAHTALSWLQSWRIPKGPEADSALLAKRAASVGVITVGACTQRLGMGRGARRAQRATLTHPELPPRSQPCGWLLTHARSTRPV